MLVPSPRPLPAAATVAAALSLLLGLVCPAVGQMQPTLPEHPTFNAHIRPVLSDNCFSCHGTDAAHRKGKLRLDTPEGAYAERDGFRAFVPGSPEESEAWLRIVSTFEDERMPPIDTHKPALTEDQRTVIRRWIEQGARYEPHWAYAPITRPALPAPLAGAGDHPVDRFVGARLAAEGWTLAPEASPEVLFRRLSLDLVGLPPTVEALDAFLADRNPGAYERAVDRLLASPHYGEHAARLWLDAVRYGDTHGMHLDNERTIWPYRDWVVKALNDNLPFDQFTIQQLAGDLLPAPTVSQLVATGYLRSNLSTSEGGTLEAEAEARNTSDRTDTTTAVWMGLTGNCASCHDHKFDPLTQKEYYAFGAFFKGLADRTWDGNVRLPGPRVLLGDEQQVARIEQIARELVPLEAALAQRADALLPALPKVSRTPVTYEVIWAEDGDVPTVARLDQPAGPGEWRSGPEVPRVGGDKALFLAGPVTRSILFAAGDVTLVARTGLVAFAHVRPDPVSPPKAIALQLHDERGAVTRQRVWGDPKALGLSPDADVVVAGPMPLPGAYLRLDLDARALGLDEGARYTSLSVVQSDGQAWWDRFGTVNTSASAAEDPLLSLDGWINPLRKGSADRELEALPVTLDIKYLISLFILQQNDDEKQRRADYYRRYIYGPLRGAVEAEAHAARRLQAEQVRYEQTLPGSPIARERPEPLPAHVLIRGQYDQLGEKVEPTTPAFLPPLTASAPRASRLDLARWLVDPAHPLTARVAVNRLWQQVFGTGLVRTPGDFGSQGEPPTHPELLDWLASEFIATGWDQKAMIRLLVTSQTYRQASHLAPDRLERDPANRLLARSSRTRLDAEVLRDQALAVSGLLVPKLGGPPVRPYQPDGIWEPVAYPDSNTRFYAQDTGEALYRRTLYTFIKRNAPAPALTTFDAPSREAFCVGRATTNTPLQALALMNDVQHVEAARAFAARLLAQPGGDAERLAHGFRTVTGREPDADERALLAEALQGQRARYAGDEAAARAVLSNGALPADDTHEPKEHAAWTLVANLLLNLDEALVRN